MSNNPYAHATGTYDKNAQQGTADPRELEARILLKANKRFKALQEKWDDMNQEELNDVLDYNRQIWMMFTDTAIEDQNEARGHELRSNIASLGMFIFKHTLDVLANPKREKLNVLIEINTEIAAGLMTKPASKTSEVPEAEQSAKEKPSSQITT